MRINRVLTRKNDILVTQTGNGINMKNKRQLLILALYCSPSDV